MSNTLLNIAGKIDSEMLSLYQAVSDAAASLRIPFVVVGASARDLVMRHGYQVPVERATQDVDFGIQVSTWDAFYVLKEVLQKQGFSSANAEHRLYNPQDIPIDIIPFGGNQDENAQISWPPQGNSAMSVLGFQEACDNALQVRIQEEPEFDIPVATPEGMVLLKLIAWTDRDKGIRTKDATDILYLMKHYEEIPAVRDALYGDDDLMGAYDWDLTLAAAFQLGAAARNIALAPTVEAIEGLFQGQHKQLSTEQLIEEISASSIQQFDRHSQLLTALANGFQKSGIGGQ